MALVGRKNLGLRNDQHVELGRRALYLTPLNDVFGLRSRRSGRV